MPRAALNRSLPDTRLLAAAAITITAKAIAETAHIRVSAPTSVSPPRRYLSRSCGLKSDFTAPLRTEMGQGISMPSFLPPPRPPADHARRVCRGMKRVLLFALRAALAKHLRVAPMDFGHAVPSVTPCSTTGVCRVSSVWSGGLGSSPHKYRQKQTGPGTLWHRLRCDHYGVREQLGTAISAPLRSFPFRSWPFAKSQACSQRKARYYAGSLCGGD